MIEHSFIGKLNIREVDTNSDFLKYLETIIANYLVQNQVFEFSLTGTDLKSVYDFLNKLGETTVHIPELNKDTFIAIRSRLTSAPARTIYSTAGHYNNIFVYANGYFDYVDNQAHFGSKFDITKDFDCIENSFVSLNNPCRPYCYWEFNTAIDDMRAFFNNFCRVFNNSEVLAVFGAGLGVCFWDIFQKIGQGFPVLILTGESQSGKTTIAKALSAIYGLFSDSGFTSGSSTQLAIHIATSQRHNIPLFVEELNVNIFKQFDVFVKNIFSAIPRERCKSKNNNDITRVYTSVFATSNHFFTNPKLETLSRILTATMRKSDFDLRKYEYFDAQKRKRLSQILPWILAYRSHVERFYYDISKQLAPHIDDDRCLNNLTISSVMWHLVNTILGYPYVNWQKMSIEAYAHFKELRAAEIKVGDFVIRSIAQLIEKDKLTYGNDYRLLKDNKTLRISLRRFAEKQNTHAPQTSYLVKEEKLRPALQSDPRFVLDSIPMKNIGRAISIDISDQECLLEKISESKRLYTVLNNGKEDDE